MAKDKTYTKESVYEEIKGAYHKGKQFRNELKRSFSEELLREGKVRKIGSRYYHWDIFPSSGEVYRKIEIASEKGTHLTDLEAGAIQPLIDEGKIKKVGRRKIDTIYYLTEFAPLYQKEIVERLLTYGILKRLGKKYIFVRKIRDLSGPLSESESLLSTEYPSFLEFLVRVQEIYLHKAGRYRESIRILPLMEELTSELGLSRTLAEKWILELPRIFIGIVDLRPFSGEHGLELRDGTEVSRIYLNREIVGL